MQFTNRDESRLPNYEMGWQPGMLTGAHIDFNHLAQAMDCRKNFWHAGIIYHDGRQSWLVRPARRTHPLQPGEVSHIVITALETGSENEAQEAFIQPLQSTSLTRELSSAALPCGAAIATLALIIFASSAIPLTAGVSGIPAVLLSAGSAATALQCANGVMRIMVLQKGSNETLEWLDSQGWYQATITLLDIISIASASVALKQSILLYKSMKKVSSIKVHNWLKTMPRADRKRLTEEIIRNRNPGISNRGIKSAIQAGLYPKRYPTEVLQISLNKELAQMFINSSSFIASATEGTLRHLADPFHSGRYAVGFLQSFSTDSFTPE